MLSVQYFFDYHHWQTQSQRDLVVVLAMITQPALCHRLASWPVPAVVPVAALVVEAELAPEVVSAELTSV